MRPWCDRPLCTRQNNHQHAPEAPETPLGASVSDPEPVPVPVPHENGSGAHKRSAVKVAAVVPVGADTNRDRQKLPGTSAPPKSEDEGGAASEVVADVATDPNPWQGRWATIAAEIEVAETRLASARARRRELFAEMADELGLAGVGEVTGLTRQRVGQILKP